MSADWKKVKNISGTSHFYAAMPDESTSLVVSRNGNHWEWTAMDSVTGDFTGRSMYDTMAAAKDAALSWHHMREKQAA